MAWNTFRIKSCGGIGIKVDSNWIIVGTLFTWILAQGIFPYYYRHLNSYIYWTMAVCSSLLLPVFIILHEIFHALACRLTITPIRSINLFVFGGVADCDNEIKSVRGEFFVAIFGLLINFLLYLVFHFFKVIAIKNHIPNEYVGIIEFSMIVNLIIFLFNILPAYPLDGGRIMRAILWKVGKDIFWATKLSSWVGVVVGLLMLLAGIFFIFRGPFISGILFLTIGIFLQNASKSSITKFSIEKAFEGESVANFMSDDPVTVSPSISVENFINKYLSRYHYKFFPIVENDKKLLGAISSQKVMTIPKDQWEIKKISELIIPCSSENTVHKDTDALKIMEKMIRTEKSKMLVIDSEEKCVGIVALKDLLKLLSCKLDLEN